MTEVRLIDANALRHKIHCAFSDDLGILEYIDNAPTVEPKPISGIQEKALKVVEILTEEHAINVNERRFLQRAILLEPERPQGEWKLIERNVDSGGNNRYECSECHYKDDHAGSVEVPFCWHCGADMRGTKE